MKKILLSIFISLYVVSGIAQTSKHTLNLKEVIDLALSQSLDIHMAKNQLKSSYWEFRTFKAELLPSLTIEATLPNYNRRYKRFTKLDKDDKLVDNFYEENTLFTKGGLKINQNIALTGGSFFINSDISRSGNLDNDSLTVYNSSPISIGFTQPLASFNRFRWMKKIEPLKYKIAKKTYIESLEQISYKATQYYFSMASAQVRVAVDMANQKSNDTLYMIAQGRFKMGKISKNDLLQMELNALNSKSSLKQSLIDYQTTKFRLRSFIGYNDNVDIELKIDDTVPEFQIEPNKAIYLAAKNNSKVLNFEKQLTEANRDVAQAKAGRFFSANLRGSLGLTQKGNSYSSAYKSPNNQLGVEIGISIPIIDWGHRRGKYLMANSKREVVRLMVQQSKIDFNQNIKLQVDKFNNQKGQLQIAKKANEIAQSKFDITKKRFLIGKITVLELDKAITEKDQAKISRINAIRNYWEFYYTMRKLTLYDFENNKRLVDYDTSLDYLVK